MITPTVGRVVWYRPAPDEFTSQRQPFAAIVTYVWSDTFVNLVAFDRDGIPHGRTQIQLRQGDEPVGARYAEWMPYQKGQAAKADALEQKLAEKPAA